jgi:hypothetical protein
VILTFFEKNFDIIERVLSGNKAQKNKIQVDKQSKSFDVEVGEDLDRPWVLKKVHANSLSTLQQAYGRLFYWAGYYGEQRLCQLFLKKVGISPFMKFHESQNVISACIKGCQYDLLKYLIEDSKKGAWERCGYKKYEFDTREIKND